MGALKMQEQIARVENAGVDKVWKAVRIKYSVNSIWQLQFPRVHTNNLEHTPTNLQSTDTREQLKHNCNCNCN